MSARRLTLFVFLVTLVLPAAARAGIPVGMYPFRIPGLTAAQRTDLHGILEAGLVTAARRGILQPRSPLLQPASCGEAMTPTCLATAAREGLILVGRGEARGAVYLVSAALYDRNGARTREVRFVVDLVIQNMRPVGEALMELEMEIDPDGTIAGAKKPLPPERDARGPKAVAAAPSPPPRPAATPPVAAPTPPRPLAAAPAAAPPAPRPAPAAAAPARRALDVSAPATPALWKRQAGPFFTVLGGALLAGGAAVAVVNQKLTDDLNAKRTAGTLTAADRSSYDKVDRYNVISTALFAAGGVSAAAGTWIWISAPASPGSGAVAVAGGRF